MVGFLKNLIFEEVQENTEKVGVVENTAPISTVITSPIITNQSLDPKAVEHFEKVLDSTNIPGMDYYEFKKAIKNVTNLPEDMAFKNTYQTLNVVGLTKETLLSSIDVYIEAINKSVLSFNDQAKTIIKEQVDSKRNQVIENNKQIESLQNKIIELQQQNLNLQNEASNNELQIRNTIGSFEIASKSYLENLISDKSKINTYIS